MFQKFSKYKNVELVSDESERLYKKIKSLRKKIKSLKLELKEAEESKNSMKPRFKDLKNEKIINLDKSFNIKLLRAKVEKRDINKIYDDYENEKKETIKSYDEKYLKRLANVESDIEELKSSIHDSECTKKLAIGKYNLSKKDFKLQRKIISNIKYEAKTKLIKDRYEHEIKLLELKNKMNLGSITDEEFINESLKINGEFEVQDKLNIEESKIIYDSFIKCNKTSIKTGNIIEVNKKISETSIHYKVQRKKIIDDYKIELAEENQKYNEKISEESVSKEKLKEIKLEHDLVVKQIKFLKYSNCKMHKDDIKDLKKERSLYRDSLMTNKERIIMRFYVDAETFQTRFKSLNAIKLTFLTVFPIILLGAFVTLFTTVVFGTGDGSIVDIFNITLTHEGILWLSRINKFFQVIGAGTNGVVALYILVVMSYNVSKNYNQNVIWVSTITSVIAFFLLSNNFLESFAVFEATLGTTGMLSAIVLPIIIVKIFSVLDNSEKLKFKLPASIPDAVAKSLNALVPMFILLTAVSFVAITLRFITPSLDPMLDYLPGNFVEYGSKTLAELLSLMITIPMNFFFESNIYLGVAIFLTLTSFIWWCGINSSAILGAFMWTKFGAGAPDSSFKDSFFGSQLMDTMIDIGGSGGTFALVLVVMFVTRRSNWKMVSRIAFIPALFGINEPILFGLPIVFNPVMLAPFVLAPLAAAVMYVMIQGFGIMDLTINKANVVPWTAPPIFGAYWSTGSWTGAVFAGMVIIVQSIIYTPFVMIDNNIYKMSVETQSEDNSFSFKKDALKIINEIKTSGDGESHKLDEYINPQEEYTG